MVFPGTLYSPNWSISLLVSTKSKKSFICLATAEFAADCQALPQNTVNTSTFVSSGPLRYVSCGVTAAPSRGAVCRGTIRHGCLNLVCGGSCCPAAGSAILMVLGRGAMCAPPRLLRTGAWTGKGLFRRKLHATAIAGASKWYDAAWTDSQKRCKLALWAKQSRGGLSPSTQTTMAYGWLTSSVATRSMSATIRPGRCVPGSRRPKAALLISGRVFVAKGVKSRLASPLKKLSNANQTPGLRYEMFFNVVSMSFVVPV